MKRTPLARRTPLRPRAPKKPWRRKPRDRTPTDVRMDVFARDGYRCIAPILAAYHEAPIDTCKGAYGQRAVVYVTTDGPVYDLSALTFEHVKFVLRAGKRAASDEQHGVTLCSHHNATWALTSEHKEWEREYLRGLYGVIAA